MITQRSKLCAVATLCAAAALALCSSGRPTAAAFDTGHDVAVYSAGYGNNYFWSNPGNSYSGNSLATTLDNELGAGNWSFSAIGSGDLSSSGLANFEVLVLTGADRDFAGPAELAAIKSWVEGGGRLIIDPLGGLDGNDPVTAQFGAGYETNWLGWSGDWCGAAYTFGVTVPDPGHPMLNDPNVVGEYWSCDHTSMSSSALGAEWTPLTIVNGSYYGTGPTVPLAVTSPGSGVVVAAGIHFDHFTPGQIALAANIILAAAESNQAPVAQAQNVTVNTDPGLGTAAVAASAFDNGSYDPDGDAITIDVSPAGPYAVGATSVTLTVTDAKGASSSAPATVTVIDNQAPSLSGLSVNTNLLWPPNHQMVDIAVTYTAADNHQVASVVLTGASSEADNGLGDGDTANDVQVVSSNLVRLRAERSGKGSGRTYTLTVTVTDASGNTTSGNITVSVPHSKKK